MLPARLRRGPARRGRSALRRAGRRRRPAGRAAAGRPRRCGAPGLAGERRGDALARRPGRGAGRLAAGRAGLRRHPAAAAGLPRGRCGPGCCRWRRWRWPRPGRRRRCGRLLAAAGPAAEDLALPRAILAEAEGKAEAALAGYDRVAAGPRPPGPGAGDPPGGGAAPRHRPDRCRRRRPRRWRRRCSPGAAMRPRWRRGCAWPRCGATRAMAAAPWRCCGRRRRCCPTRPRQLQPALRDSFLAALAAGAAARRGRAVRCLSRAAAGRSAWRGGGADAGRAAGGARSRRSRGGAAAAGDGAGERAPRAARSACGWPRCGSRKAMPRGALAALADSAAPDLPPELVHERAVLAARAEARRGQPAGGGRRAARARPRGRRGRCRSCWPRRQDWAGAAAALARASRRGPAGTRRRALDDPQRRLLLRQAALLALAGDEAALGCAARRRRPRGWAKGRWRRPSRCSPPIRCAASAICRGCSANCNFSATCPRGWRHCGQARRSRAESRVPGGGERQYFRQPAQKMACAYRPLAPYAAAIDLIDPRSPRSSTGGNRSPRWTLLSNWGWSRSSSRAKPRTLQPR